mgnify:CR=1 FL=1
MDMKERLQELAEAAGKRISESEGLEKLNEVRVAYLGKKGELTTILRGMGSLTPEERPIVGKLVYEAKSEVEAKLEEVGTAIKTKEKNAKLASEVIDISLPGKKQVIGKRHPLDLTLERMKEIFISMGFSIEDGPEVELDHYNFEALNIPKDHPARSEQDTFYINDNIVLRTQTSPIQIRTMENQEPPIKMISPGKVYRSDAVDATHSPMFHQIEGLVVGKDVTMAQLKGTLDMFVKKLFGENTKTKFRPHNFPFTEPSAEVDVTCFKCQGAGCPMCKQEGWIEILGAGMVHPNVLRNCGIDPEVYSGFAFGMGVDRITMLKYEIDDIRLLFENDMRFLDQF